MTDETQGIRYSPYGKKHYVVPCMYCGAPVTRSQPRTEAACFNCKTKRKKIRANKHKVQSP